MIESMIRAYNADSIIFKILASQAMDLKIVELRDKQKAAIAIRRALIKNHLVWIFLQLYESSLSRNQCRTYNQKIPEYKKIASELGPN